MTKCRGPDEVRSLGRALWGLCWSLRQRTEQHPYDRPVAKATGWEVAKSPSETGEDEGRLG
jgi:hypothetical protein